MNDSGSEQASASKPWRPKQAICGHAFSGTHVLLMGEKDGDVGTARDADILHSELDQSPS